MTKRFVRIINWRMYKSYHLLKAEKFYKYDNTMTLFSYEKYLQNFIKESRKLLSNCYKYLYIYLR